MKKSRMMAAPIKYGPHDKYVEVWGCESASSDNVYTVARTALDVWSCSCPRWTLNASRPECKHIAHVKQFAQQAHAISIPVVPVPEKVQKALSRFAMLE